MGGSHRDEIDSCNTLRKNEKLLRRCGSVKEALELLPSLIDHPSLLSGESMELLGVTEHDRPIYSFKNLPDTCFFIPGFLSNTESMELSHSIVRGFIDSPPHSNSLSYDSRKDGLWKGYLRDPSDLSCAMNHLRWSCVGYHYDWGGRSYNRGYQSHFPKEFTHVYEKVLNSINRVWGRSVLSGNPESAIINFYHSHRVSDRLGGHRDDVEETDSSPLVSISLGRTGVFLIEDQAVCLRSGDVVVMTRNARQSLHGIPVVFPPEQNQIMGSVESIDQTWKEQITSFLSKTRISISIRQVY